MLLLLPATALSHPHAWIDLHVDVDIDDSQNVHTLTQTWVFDPVYTMLLLEEYERALPGADQTRQLEALRDRMMESMADYDHMTEVRLDEQPLEIAGAEETRIKIKDDEVLKLRFTLKLDEPAPLTEGSLSYRIFDPTYYIEMLHPGEEAVRLKGTAEDCRVQIIEPRPNAAHLAQAAAVDLGGSADGLGRHFAQWVEIDCSRSGEDD